MDFYTDIPTTTKPFTFLAVVDRFSKMLVLINFATKLDTKVVAYTFFEYGLHIHGLPHMIISEYDPHFEE